MTAGRRVRIELPPGLVLLTSNQRLHHQRRAEVTRGLREAAAWVARAHPVVGAQLARSRPLFGRVHVLGVVHPGRRGRADPANWYPSFKAAVDGLVDAGLIEDDDHTHLDGPDMRIGPVVRGGQLTLHVRALAPGEYWPDFGLDPPEKER